MGREKIDIKYISDPKKRKITFIKRAMGIMDKCAQLEIITGCRIGFFVSNEEETIHMLHSQWEDPRMELTRMARVLTTPGAHVEIDTPDNYEIKAVEHIQKRQEVIEGTQYWDEKLKRWRKQTRTKEGEVKVKLELKRKEGCKPSYVCDPANRAALADARKLGKQVEKVIKSGKDKLRKRDGTKVKSKTDF
jgi:hypothetical protein